MCDKVRNGEMRVLACLGVKTFRRWVLSFEKLRHKEDGGYNVNYHVERVSLRGLHAFSGYLILHTVIHTVGILLAAVCCLLPLMLPHTGFAAVIGGVCGIGNLYCLLLQRYTYLKLTALIQKREKKQRARDQKRRQALQRARDGKDPALLAEETALITEIYNCVLAGDTYVLTADKTDILYRLAAAIGANPKPQKAGSQTVDALPTSAAVYPFAKRAAAFLQTLFGVQKEYNLLFSVNILPENVQTARAYRALVGCDTDEWAVWKLLYE